MKKFPFKRTKLTIALGLGLICLIAVIWVLWPKSTRVETATVMRSPYEQFIEEDGVTRAREIYTLSSIVAGNLKRVTLRAGDRVQKGDVLFEIDWDRPVKVRSPASGWVLRVIQESAAAVERGAPIMEVADATSLEIVVDVLTTEAVKIKAGVPVRIKGWGGTVPLQGRVRRVEPSAFKKVSALGVEEQRVNVIIDIKEPYAKWEGLGNNYKVDCEIIIYRTDDALTIPTGALFRDGDNWAVYRVDGETARKQVLDIVRRNPKQAMVADGLKTGDRVILYPSDEIQDGSRIKAMSQ